VNDPYMTGQLRGTAPVVLPRRSMHWSIVSALILGLFIVAGVLLYVMALDARDYALTSQAGPPQEGPAGIVDKFDLMTVEAYSHKEEASAMMTVEASRAERDVYFADQTKTAGFDAEQTAQANLPTPTPDIMQQYPVCDEEMKTPRPGYVEVECVPYRAAPVPTENPYCDSSDYTSIVTSLKPCRVVPPTVVPTLAPGVVPTSASLPSPPSSFPTPTAGAAPIPNHYQGDS
jgi:hypothetical protein